MSKNNSQSAPYEFERQKALETKLAYYDDQRKTLAASKKRQQEMAGITLDKLQKYLPYQIKAQGLSGSGASESTMLQAHANYANTMADIEGKHNTRMSEIAAYESNDIQAVHDKYDAKAESASNDAYNELSIGVQEMLDKYVGDDGKISRADMDKIEDYINSNGAALSVTDRGLLNSLLDKYEERTDTEQGALDYENAKNANKVDVVKLNGATNTANSGYGDNFSVTVGNDVFNVEKGNDITDDATAQAITKAFGGTPGVGSSVVYNGKIYMWFENNNTQKSAWCEIQGREMNDKSFRKLCEVLGLTAYSRGDNPIKASKTKSTSSYKSTSKKPGRNEHGKW